MSKKEKVRIAADMHLHTLMSDGIDSADTVIQKCIDKGLDVISITDHDLGPDISYMEELQRKYPIKLIIGMECGSKCEKHRKHAHILGYGIKNFAKLNKIMAPVLERRHANSVNTIHKLQKMGYPITVEEVASIPAGKIIYRQHIIYTLYKKGIIEEMWGEWYHKMYKNSGPFVFQNEYPEPAEITALIRESGGVPVLAHPGQQQNFCLVPELKAAGLQGIELIHPSNSEADQQKVLEYAEAYQLICTGGSDYHGILSSSGGVLGKQYITYEKLPELLNF